jgi:hypothetical protein
MFPWLHASLYVKFFADVVLGTCFAASSAKLWHQRNRICKGAGLFSLAASDSRLWERRFSFDERQMYPYQLVIDG